MDRVVCLGDNVERVENVVRTLAPDALSRKHGEISLETGLRSFGRILAGPPSLHSIRMHGALPSFLSMLYYTLRYS